MADLKKAKMGHLFTGAVAEGMCPGGGDVLGYYLSLGHSGCKPQKPSFSLLLNCLNWRMHIRTDEVRPN